MRVETGILDLRSLYQTLVNNSRTASKQDLLMRMEKDFGISEPNDYNLISPLEPTYDSVAVNFEIVDFSIGKLNFIFFSAECRYFILYWMRYSIEY